MKDFYQYIERQWIHGIASTMLSVYGRTRRTNSEVEGFHRNFGKRMAQKRPNFWYFLKKLKSVAKAYHLEVIQLGKGILSRRYKRQSSKRIDRYISEAEQKLEEGRYTSMEYLKVVAHVTEQSFDKNHMEEKENLDSQGFRTFHKRRLWQKHGGGRFGKNMAADVSAKKYAETSQAKNICRNVSYDIWGISGVCTLALTVAKTSYHYDRFAISVPARSLLLFDLA